MTADFINNLLHYSVDFSPCKHTDIFIDLYPFSDGLKGVLKLCHYFEFGGLK